MAIAAIYAALGKMGQLIAIPPGNVTAVWPPSGFALAMFIVVGKRAWVGVFLGAFIINTIAFVDTETTKAFVISMTVGITIGLGSALQPAIGARLLYRHTEVVNITRKTRAFLFFVGFIPLMCLISSFIGTSSLYVGGFVPLKEVGELWLTWWLGDSVGILVVAPLILAWRRFQVSDFRLSEASKIVWAHGLLVGISLVSFGGAFSGEYSIEFLVWPLLLWLALQYGTHHTALGIVILTAVAVSQTVKGYGPFALEDSNHSLLLLQLFLSVTAATIGFVNCLAQERRHARIQTEEALEKAKHANNAKSEFLSSMSHELRTPMNSILGFGQLLRDANNSTLNPKQKEYVAHILNAGEHLLELIEQVLELEKIETGHLHMKITTVSLSSAIEECVTFIQPEADKQGVTVITDLGEGNSILADQTGLKQVLLNLMTNAIKYNVEGGTLSIRCHRSREKQLRIEVQDSGFGIPEKFHGNIFEAFNRLGQANSSIAGTGVGLSVSKKLTEAMNGHIGFHSKEGTGSTFWLEFPLAG